MPVEAKPLFRPSVLGPRLAGFSLPEAAELAADRLPPWVELVHGPRAERLTESELLPDFITHVFYELLGYAGPSADPGGHTLSRERRVEVDGEYADAVLGRLGSEPERVVAAVEGKRPVDPLDRPFGGRRMSAVDQGYRYAINLRCDWILVTNLREIRLYHKGHDQRTFERFELRRLAESRPALERFVYLLGAERVVPAAGPCHLDALLEASDRADVDLTRAYYAEYSAMRRDVLDLLRAANPVVQPETLLYFTQKLLDRVLFIAFCEDRGLLPAETLRRAVAHTDPYNPKPRWETFKGLFRAIDQGSGELGIPGYNGGLFQTDSMLDSLAIPAPVFDHFRHLGEFDYREVAHTRDDEEPAPHLVDVEILGHIFEQSITDLERIQSELAAGEFDAGHGVSRRKREGAFYTPDFVTRFIVGRALRPVVEDRFRRLRDLHLTQARKRSDRTYLVLDDPRIYDLAKLQEPQRKALIAFWEAWIVEIQTVRLLDPACGSGAFLIEAFNQFHDTYQEASERLVELRGGKQALFDSDRTILQSNLYGVDLNEEAIQICRLSIWIKTAQSGKRLTDLDHNVRVGNSLIEDPEIAPRNALDWRAAFPEVFAGGGFDVVVGNPPYVRQELLGSLKPHLEREFEAYHGMADLYVYFFERGLELLRPGGRLSFVVTNKWLRAGYAEPLRRLLAERARVETVVDLGHAKQVFEEADVFPSIVVLAKGGEGEERSEPPVARVSVIPRDELRIEDLERQVEEQGFDLPQGKLGGEPWLLEPPAVGELMAKITEHGVPLAEYAGAKPYRGVLTGLNEAFLIDRATRDRLIAEDPASANFLKPYLRGQDVDRWLPRWGALWMIVLESSADHSWPWSVEPSDSEAERIFRTAQPAIHGHLKRWEQKLRARQDRGRYWWELRSCNYYELFATTKLTYQEIQFHPSYCFDDRGYFGNNKTYFLPVADLYLLAVLNAPLMWWHNWRFLVHLKDEALTPATYKMEKLPIALPPDSHRTQTESAVRRRLDIAAEEHATGSTLLDWLAIEHQIDKPSRALAEPFALDTDAFVAEVRRLRGPKRPLSAAALRSLREEHGRTIAPMAERLSEAERIERELAVLVNQAYGLTPEEVELMWRTAPPRMPPGRPAASTAPEPLSD